MPHPRQCNWNDYYRAVAGRPPRETLLIALQHFATEGIEPGFAVDLGCGDGRDTIELLRRGWRVLAIDGESDAIATLLNRPDIDPDHLQTQLARFEDLTLPDAVDLINASFCLPFCRPEAFPHLWQTITQALRPGGRFAGQLFGERDSWASNPEMNHHTREQLDQLLLPYVVEFLDGEDHPGKTALGEEKHWHIWNLVLKKR